jgi:hypothetical protein
MNDSEGVGLLRDIRDDLRKIVGFVQRTQAEQQEAEAEVAQHEAEKAEFARNP